MHICIIGSNIRSTKNEKSSVKLIIEAAEKRGIKLSNIPKSEIKYKISNSGIEYFHEDIDFNSVDIFFFRDITGLKKKSTDERIRILPEVITFAKALSMQYKKRVFDNFLLAPYPELNKLKAYHILSEQGLRIVDSYLFMTKADVKISLDRLTFPLILKPVNGVRGNGIYKFENKEEIISFLDNEMTSHFFYPNILQKYIENDGDYRVVVLGGEVIACVKKNRAEGSVISNMSKGNEAVSIDINELSSDLKDLAIKSAQAIGIEFAGVDIIEDRNTKEKFVLEVNLSPQIYYTSQFSNISIADKLIEYLIKTS